MTAAANQPRVLARRYICIGGWVGSGTDHREWISATKLPALYGVPIERCLLVRDIAPNPIWPINGQVVLTPDPSGQYELPGDSQQGPAPQGARKLRGTLDEPTPRTGRESRAQAQSE